MTKVTLNDVGNLIDATTAKTTINGNYSTIETAFDNTLSRDGTLPNHMDAELDMNSNRIINLVEAVGSAEPVRKKEFDEAVFAPLGLLPSEKGFVIFKGDLAGVRTLQQGSGVSITNGDGQIGDPTVSLNGASIASLALADSAVQPLDLGDLAYKDKAAIPDIDALGTPSSSTYLRGDGSWSVPSGAGDMAASVYDPNGYGKDVYTTLTPMLFGAVGDGVTDDTVALNAAVAATSGKILDLKGKTYLVSDSILVPSNTFIMNGTIDFTTASDTAQLFVAKGTKGSSVSFSASSRGFTSFIVSSAAGISKGNLLLLNSADIFGVGSVARGEIVRVQDVTGTTVTPWRRIYDTYTTTPIFYKPTFLTNITFQNLVLIGKDTTTARQYAFNLELIDIFRVENVTSRNFGDRHYQITNCLGGMIKNCDIRGISHGVIVGLSYGIAANEATQDLLIEGCRFRDLKHAVALGGETGVARCIKVTKCFASEIFDASYDCHPNSQFITFDDNECDNNSPIGSVNGIVAQGANVTITNNRIKGFAQVGILAQPACVDSAILDDVYVISGNQVSAPYAGGTETYSIYFQNLRTSSQISAVINDNFLNDTITTDSNGITIEVPAGKGLVRDVSISNNVIVMQSTGIILTTGASGAAASIQGVSISGNSIRCQKLTEPCIAVNSGQASFISTVGITGNVTYGGLYSISNTSGNPIGSGGNMLRAWGSAATNGTIVSMGTNYTL